MVQIVNLILVFRMKCEILENVVFEEGFKLFLGFWFFLGVVSSILEKKFEQYGGKIGNGGVRYMGC